MVSRVTRHSHNYVVYAAYVIYTISLVTALSSTRDYDGSQVFRVYVPTLADWRTFHAQLTSTAPSGQRAIIDFWRPPVHNGTADIHVAGNDVIIARKLLDDLGFRHHVIVEDVATLIRHETSANNHRRRRSTHTNDVIGRYARYQEILDWMESLAVLHPTIAKVIDIGHTAEGRRMKILKLGVSGRHKWKVWLDGGIHAREWISPATVIYMANQLVEGYMDKDPDVREFLQKVDWYFLPIVNPDGYEYSHTHERLWRKNRKFHNASGCHGVDLNRNWRFQWGGAYSSEDPCDNVYRGEKAEDELEVKNMVRFLDPRAPSFIAFITFHSYGQRFITRWDYSREVLPNDHHQLMSLAEKAVSVMQSVHGTVYEAGRAPDLMYPYGGGSPDWARAIANIKYSYLVELRDQNSFLLPPEQIVPTGEENWAALRVIAREVLHYYGDLLAPHVDDPPHVPHDHHVTTNHVADKHIKYEVPRGEKELKISVVFHRNSASSMHGIFGLFSWSIVTCIIINYR